MDIEDWNEKRAELIEEASKDHFSNDISLDSREMKANKKLSTLRTKLLEEDDTIATGFYYEKLDKLLKCDLHNCLKIMPKPAIHHIHLTAACPIYFLVE